MALVFRDGDKANMALDNLELVTRAELMRRNSVHRNHPQIVELLRLRAVITRKINQRSPAA
jgi:HNH endonuclease